MARSKRHRAVDFEVGNHVDNTDRVFKTWDEAAGYAVAIAASGRSSAIDVLIWSRAGAKAYGGDDAVARYDEDPEASVFERIVIKANSQGRVP